MSNNSRQAIKHIELMSEQMESLEQQNDDLQGMLNTAICMLCSNKATLKNRLNSDNKYVYWLDVESLDREIAGSFGEYDTPYKAVYGAITEYLDMVERGEV